MVTIPSIGFWNAIATLINLNFAEADKAHFGMISEVDMEVSSDSEVPSYIVGQVLVEESSEDFEIVVSSDGSQWIKNIGTKTLKMTGDAVIHLGAQASGRGILHIWSERSSDDGETFTINPLSLRSRDVDNAAQDGKSIPSAFTEWLPGVSIRWALYNAGLGTIQMEAPVDTSVYNGESVSGVSFAWILEQV